MLFTEFFKSDVIKTPISIVVGVWHGEPIAVPLKDIIKFNQENNRIYYEGQKPEPVVVQFTSNLDTSNAKSWEPHLEENETIPMDLWGGDFRAFKQQVKGKTIWDALVSSAQSWHGKPIDPQALQSVLTTANLLDFAQKSNDLRQFHTQGAKVYQYASGPLHDLYISANKKRVGNIVNLMRSGGLFFAGNSHLKDIRKQL